MSTWLGSVAPEWQADPPETAMPFRSSADDQRFTFEVVEPDIRGVGGTGGRLAVGHRAVQTGSRQRQNSRFELVTQRWRGA